MQSVDPGLLKGMQWRLVGPFRGGRVVAVAGDPSNDPTFYFGSTGGGVWKTIDGGTTWENVSDGYFKRASVGAIAVAESDPNVIYVGMGEAHIRGNVSHGDGVYKSTDAGKSWQHLGLTDTRNIGRVRVHPSDPNLVYVAALGHAHGPNQERGIFRSKDGGASWEHVLFRADNVGAIDLTMDHSNPRILYASFWEAIRRPHEMVSGGPGSSIYRSTDGGDTWEEITRNPGLPQGTLGKIGIVASPAKPDRVWAIIEAEDGALFRSDDGGDSWQRLSDDRNLRQRPWYYMHIYADPLDPETLWILNLGFWKSTDGGKTFSSLPTRHGDNHDLWIDPKNPLRMIQGNDGGAHVSFNGGYTWSDVMNQPTMEFYHVITDNQVPYRIYGAQQDNTTISVPNRSRTAGITRAEWHDVGGGESGYIAIKPTDENIVFAGSYGGLLTRYDHRTGQRQNVAVWPEASLGTPARDLKYRFQWTYPTHFSPHDPNVLYVTSQHVHRSTDEGMSWEVISPDLTRNDKTRQGPTGGPITGDNVGTEYYDTIFAFAESPVTKGVLWTGSDDGLVHVSRDNGQSWQNVTPPDLPPWALISIIDASPHDAGTAYVAATRYKSDDFTPYIYKTTDYGQTWTKIVNGIPGDEFTRVAREDPNRRDLLYAGTEAGLYVSFDGGANWQSLRLAGEEGSTEPLPVVPIHDLTVKEKDLVVATHGRSFWVLDDLTPLYELSDSVAQEPAHLFAPRPTTRFYTNRGFGRPVEVPANAYSAGGATMMAYRIVKNRRGESVQKVLDAGTNPPDGVIVYFSLKEKPAEDITLTFLDDAGKEIRSFSSKEPEKPKEEKDTAGRGRENKEPRVPAETGLNRFVWDTRYPGPTELEGYPAPEGVPPGPYAPPGRYQVRLKAGDTEQTQSFEIRKDPRVSAGQQDLDAQFALLTQIRDKLSATHEALNKIQRIRGQVDAWEKQTEGQPSNDQVKQAGEAVKSALAPIEDVLIQTKVKVREDQLAHPSRLNVKLAGLMGAAGGADARPTRQIYELFDELAKQVDEQVAKLNGVVESEVATFNSTIRDAGVPAVAV